MKGRLQGTEREKEKEKENLVGGLIMPMPDLE